jgi:hypothetical protein
MAAHLKNEVVTLATCVKIVPTRESKKPPVYLTEHDRPLSVDQISYVPSDSYTISTIKTSTDFKSDNTELTLGDKEYSDIKGFLNASVYIFYVNWNDLSMGVISLFTGFVSSVELTHEKELKMTVSGMGKKLSKKYLPKYSRTCRTSLGSTKCGVPILPVGRGDLFFSFPRTYTVGEQVYDRPSLISLPNYSFSGWGNPTGWTLSDPELTHPASYDNLTISQTVVRDVAVTDGALIMFEVEINQEVILYIDQLDINGEVLQTEWNGFSVSGKHHVTALALPNAVSFKFIINVKPQHSTTVTPLAYYYVGALPVNRNKLARVTNLAAQDKINVPNGEFYKDGQINLTNDTTLITDWEITATTQYSVINNVFKGIATTMRQTVQLPPLGCTLLSSGCYFLHVIVEHNGGTTTTLEILDDEDNVLHTYNFSDTEYKVRLDNSPDKVRITHVITNNEIQHVRMYIYNALISAINDPYDVTLNSAGEKETKSDIWLTETEKIYYNGTISAVPSQTESRIFNLTSGDLTNGKNYGTILFITGANAGIVRKVRSYNETTFKIELFDKLPNMPSTGDKVIVGYGCDKTINTCGGIFNNGINFRGEPYMPTVESLGDIINT